MDWRTSDYMVKEETKRNKLRTRAGKRAWQFEEKLRIGKGGEPTIRCFREVEERGKTALRLTR